MAVAIWYKDKREGTRHLYATFAEEESISRFVRRKGFELRPKGNRYISTGTLQDKSETSRET